MEWFQKQIFVVDETLSQRIPFWPGVLMNNSNIVCKIQLVYYISKSKLYKKSLLSTYSSFNPSTSKFDLYCFSGFNDSFEHATGVEKWELIKKKEGNDVSCKYIVLPNEM